jgi:hypothetical protein
MWVLRQCAMFVLVLMSSIAPATACMLPDAQMSAEERACCRMMKSQCEQMQMPASHGCCQKTPQTAQAISPNASKASIDPVAVTDVWLTASELLNPITVVSGLVDRLEYSPPQSPPSAVSILRI